MLDWYYLHRIIYIFNVFNDGNFNGTTCITKKSLDEISEYDKIEINQIFERLTSNENIRVQIGTFFGMANLTALGVALSTQKAGIIFIASAILIIFILMDMRLRLILGIDFYRGLQLQKKYLPDEKETFWFIYSGRLASKIHEIAKIEDLQDRKAALRRVSLSTLSFFGFWIVLIIIIFEIVGGAILWYRFSWSLF